MFERPHHRRIAGVLQALDAEVLAMAMTTVSKAALWARIKALVR